MPTRLHALTEKDILWLHRMRRDLDALLNQYPHLRRRDSYSGPNRQFIKASSTTPTDGRFPGHWYEYSPSAKTYTQMNEVWIICPNGETPNTTDYIEADQHGFENNRPVFSAPDKIVGGGGGTTITVEELDGSPSYSSISKLIFDQADGFVITNPGAGSARIDQTPASSSAVGYVTTGSQVFAGAKSFGDGLQSRDFVTLVDSTGVATKTTTFDLITNATPFFASCYISLVDSSNGDEVQLYFAEAAGVILSAKDNSTLVDAAYGVQDNAGTVTYGTWGTDLAGNTIKAGLITSIGTLVNIFTTAPVFPTSTGTAGQMAYTTGFLYVCVATDTWRRVAISSW